MVNPDNQFDLEDLPEIKVGKIEQYIKLPIIIATIYFLGLSGIAIDCYEYSAKYYGAHAITYDETYHYYPLLVMLAYYACYILRLFLERFVWKVFPQPPSERKALHLRWDMVITALAFVYLQLRVFSMLNIQYLK